jgi:hypothetical protein
MGHIAAKNKQPSCKFVFPPNLDASLKANQTFTLKLSIKNIETGYFANPAVKFYSAPQVRHPFKSYARFLVHDFADGCTNYRPSTTTGSFMATATWSFRQFLLWSRLRLWNQRCSYSSKVSTSRPRMASCPPRSRVACPLVPTECAASIRAQIINLFSSPLLSAALSMTAYT